MNSKGFCDVLENKKKIPSYRFLVLHRFVKNGSRSVNSKNNSKVTYTQTLFQRSQLDAHYFLVHLFKLFYMFQATICPSSAEHTVSMTLVFFALYGWLPGLLVAMRLCFIPTSRPDSHPYRVKNTSVA